MFLLLYFLKTLTNPPRPSRFCSTVRCQIWSWLEVIDNLTLFAHPPEGYVGLFRHCPGMRFRALRYTCCVCPSAQKFAPEGYHVAPLPYRQNATALAPVEPTSPHQQQGRPPPATARKSAGRSLALPPTDFVTCHDHVASIEKKNARVSACRAGLCTLPTCNPRTHSPTSATPTRNARALSPVSATRTRNARAHSPRSAACLRLVFTTICVPFCVSYVWDPQHVHSY